MPNSKYDALLHELDKRQAREDTFASLAQRPPRQLLTGRAAVVIRQLIAENEALKSEGKKPAKK